MRTISWMKIDSLSNTAYKVAVGFKNEVGLQIFTKQMANFQFHGTNFVVFFLGSGCRILFNAMRRARRQHQL